MAEEIINGTIVLDEIAQDAKKINLVYGQQKFSLWIKKLDGNNTKAYDSWTELRPMVGDTIDVQYKEEDAEWDNPSGKHITFKRRTVLQIRKASGAPSAPKPSQNAVSASKEDMSKYVTREEFENKIKDMSAAFMKIQADVLDLKNSRQESEYPPFSIEVPEGL